MRRDPFDRPAGLHPLTGRSRAIARVVDQIHHLAPTSAIVLIEGERGAGKARVARALHLGGARRDGPFVRAALDASNEREAEAELFGVDEDEDEDGSPRPGRLDLAEGGTLFLDGIGHAPAGLQARLPRVFRDRAFERLGGTRSHRMDVRVIAATDQDLEAEVRAGRFREDLLRRLGAVRIVMPPLRSRREDIPALVAQFLREFNRVHARRVAGITPGALERLTAHSWPGNVGELRDLIESMVVSAHGRMRLDLSDLPAARSRPHGEAGLPRLAAGMTVEEAERHLVEATLKHTGGDKRRAAAMLGIGLRTLYRKIERYRLGVPAGR